MRCILWFLLLIAFYGCGSSSGDGCCRICDVGKACGNSCIAREFECRVGTGCACNASSVSSVTNSVLPIQLTGTWQGSWNSEEGGGSGTLSATFYQDGNKLSGQFSLEDLPCMTSMLLSIEGNIEGDIVRVITNPEDEHRIFEFGGVVETDEMAFQGDFRLAGSLCQNDSGVLEMTYTNVH